MRNLSACVGSVLTTHANVDGDALLICILYMPHIMHANLSRVYIAHIYRLGSGQSDSRPRMRERRHAMHAHEKKQLLHYGGSAATMQSIW